MTQEDKVTTFMILTFISILCFSFGIGKLFSAGIGWFFAGISYFCFTFVIFWFNNYLDKMNEEEDY